MENDEGIKLGFFKKIKLVFWIAVLAILIFFDNIFNQLKISQREDEEGFYDGLSKDQKYEEDF